ncbi:LysR family transcriptional regulator [Rhodovastum atsumiense]|nr:LysR substrate-binding domain-containing protein [Rhodovastum atsumiense]CAH2599592.1 LysR family transcriptional regulator [Rhodovastum atsumiense]
MSLPPGLDPDLLRAFAFIAEEGSFTRAAERVGRTQSAVSMQVQRLEALLGQKLLLRGKGGAVTLTPHGHYLLERARDFLAVNDEIWAAFRAPHVQGTVRLGTPDDYALRYLPQVLKRFADSHPAVDVEVLCAPSNELGERLRAGELDLTLCTEGNEPKAWKAAELWRGPLRWVTSSRHAPHRLDPLPVALARMQCSWRQAALGSLERAGIRYRVAYTSATLAGTHAPVVAGLAVTVSAIDWVPEGLRVVPHGERLPELPETAILLLKGREARQPVTDVLETHIIETFRAETRRTGNGLAAA